MDVNYQWFFNKYEPFSLAIQGIQVNYTPYPSLKHDKGDWWAVFKVKARSIIELPKQVLSKTSCEEPFQQDEMEVSSIQINIDDEEQSLNDSSGELSEIDDEDVESEYEPQFESEGNDEDDELDEAESCSE